MNKLSELGNLWMQYDVLGIDEGQFYSDVRQPTTFFLLHLTNFLFGILKVVEFCEMASQHGKIVIISALGGTYKREGFNSILDLVPKAEKIK